ncbi:MAG: hypothetical protein KGD63_02975 [Candidatus Lokiarchaeota archaeon]|nr:hypothetical protein [Candidatus Lokiarchaeota archaeon]
MNWIAMIISGLAYFLHILVDTFDWGTNFFYFNHKNLGFGMLYSKEEVDKIYISFKNPIAYFDFKYYKNKTVLSLEIFFFILMVFSIYFFSPKFFYLIIFYFLALLLHILRYYHLKKFEQNK